MSCHTFACFDCRTAVRRRVAPQTRLNDVLCPACRQPCTWLGTTISVPPRSKLKQWSELRGRLLHARDRRELASFRSRFSWTRSFDDMYGAGNRTHVTGFLKRRAAKSKPGALTRLLKKAPNTRPDAGDELD